MREFQTQSIPLPSAPGLGSEYWKSPVSTDLEIGTGVGWHAIQYALREPSRRLIAIEHTREKFEKFQRRIENHQERVSNLKGVHANAIHWVTHHVPAQSIERLWILFPNPYPKAAQSNKRWHRMPFSSRLVEILKPGGQWTLATNEAFYAEEAEAFLSKETRLKLVDKKVYSQESPLEWSPRTHFEKKYLASGQSCYQLVYERVH